MIRIYTFIFFDILLRVMILLIPIDWLVNILPIDCDKISTLGWPIELLFPGFDEHRLRLFLNDLLIFLTFLIFLKFAMIFLFKERMNAGKLIGGGRVNGSLMLLGSMAVRFGNFLSKIGTILIVWLRLI